MSFSSIFKDMMLILSSKIEIKSKNEIKNLFIINILYWIHFQCKH